MLPVALRQALLQHPRKAEVAVDELDAEHRLGARRLLNAPDMSHELHAQ